MATYTVKVEDPNGDNESEPLSKDDAEQFVRDMLKGYHRIMTVEDAAAWRDRDWESFTFEIEEEDEHGNGDDITMTVVRNND